MTVNSKSDQRNVARRECGEVDPDDSRRVCRRICAPGRDYHGGGHWYANPALDGEYVRHSVARWIVAGEQPSQVETDERQADA